MKRRQFIEVLSSLSVMIPIHACNSDPLKHIGGGILAPNSKLGHLLRAPQQKQPVPDQVHETEILIVGGGISGLSAGYHLNRSGIHDFKIIEVNDRVGGNSLGGQNSVSAFPFGAHYLSMPDHRDEPLIQFLKEINVVTGFDSKGIPLYNEEYLCFDPEERLFIHGHWQEGLIPKSGVPPQDQQQIQRFLDWMKVFQYEKGEDGKDAFAIPVKLSSNDPKYIELDQMSMYDLLLQNQFSSTYLFWYIDYCLKDDFGAGMKKVSAWAGIHYFASRKGLASNSETDTVLTWPQGNYWLVQQLAKPIQQQLCVNRVVLSVKQTDSGFEVIASSGERTEQWNCKYLVMATPLHATARMIPEKLNPYQNVQTESYPWCVANITLETWFEQSKGQPLSWDNVIYGGKGLGYVNAMQQTLAQDTPSKVVTYYIPLCEGTAKEERMNLRNTSFEEWKEIIVNDLKFAHPAIPHHIQSIEIWQWGHGMILPAPKLRTQLKQCSEIKSEIVFAHTDLSGISIFEEGFHQGLQAASELISRKKGKYEI